MIEQMAIETHIEECKNRIDRIKEFMESNSDANTSECCLNIRVLEKSIKALEEIQQYRAIGTVEEVEELLEYRAIGSIDRIKGSIETNYVLLHAYEEIGTVEELQALKEKAEPKKPQEIKISKSGDMVVYVCPTCGYPINKFDDEKRCGDCNQLIDWE